MIGSTSYFSYVIVIRQRDELQGHCMGLTLFQKQADQLGFAQLQLPCINASTRVAFQLG